jgi:MoaA/NifB/PqqE/SkfB family radical SAM enzyme
VAACDTCLWRGNFPEEANTGTIIAAYERAFRAGFISTTFWGGEPLIRQDIEEIARSCRRSGITVGLITNGFYLPERAERLSRNLDFLIVSIDAPSEKHDNLRKVKGIFARAVEGMKSARACNPKLKIFLNSVVSRLSYPDVLGMAHFARNLGASVTFESTNTGRSLDGEREVALRLEPELEKRAFNEILSLKRRGLPINNSDSYLRMFATGNTFYRCHNPKISIGVAPDGSVTTCVGEKRVIGNFYLEDAGEIVSRPIMRQFQREAESCSRCVDTGTVECSLFYAMNREVVFNTLGLFLG